MGAAGNQHPRMGQSLLKLLCSSPSMQHFCQEIEAVQHFQHSFSQAPSTLKPSNFKMVMRTVIVLVIHVCGWYWPWFCDVRFWEVIITVVVYFFSTITLSILKIECRKRREHHPDWRQIVIVESSVCIHDIKLNRREGHGEHVEIKRFLK